MAPRFSDTQTAFLLRATFRVHVMVYRVLVRVFGIGQRLNVRGSEWTMSEDRASWLTRHDHDHECMPGEHPSIPRIRGSCEPRINEASAYRYRGERSKMWI